MRDTYYWIFCPECGRLIIKFLAKDKKLRMKYNNPNRKKPILCEECENKRLEGKQ